MIAWMQNWETSNCRDDRLRFFGQMTLPRELSIREGRLIQNPVRELEACRGVKIAYQNVMVCGETNLQGIRGRIIDMTVTVHPANKSALYRRFRLGVARDGEIRIAI